MTKNELYKILEEMTPSANLVNSIDDPSWHAHRRAERLNEAHIFLLLREFFTERTGKEGTEIRRNAYFVLGKLLLKKPDPEYCQFFVNCLKKEKDKYVLAAMLAGIAELQLPPEIEIEAIVENSRNDRWLIRHSAINALKASNTEFSREAVRYWVGQMDEKKYKYELIYANAALGEIGKTEDIELLERHIHSRVRDVKDSAVYAIKNIQRRVGQKV